MAEDKLRELEKAKKERNDAYLQVKGILQGIRAGGLNPDQEAYVQLLELMFLGFKNQWTVIENLYENSILSAQHEGRLEARIDELKKEVAALRQTIDTIYNNK
jgi:hypothetical protein